MARPLKPASSYPFCSIDDCDMRGRYKGMCRKHYAKRVRDNLHKKRRAPNGAGSIQSHGYKLIHVGDGRRVLEHIYVAEKALGKKLPKGAEVHHMNEIRTDNFTPFNLIICPTKIYHKLLHKRMKELKLYGRCISTN